MKKSLYFLVIGFYTLFATDKSKFDLLTNFNNFKKYKINFDANEFKTNKIDVGNKRITNNVFSFEIEAVLFNGNEGKLENLTKAEIDALPEGPHKFFQYNNYVDQNATDFDRDMAFLYHSDIKNDIRKNFTGKNVNNYKYLRNFKFKRLLIAMKTKDNKIFCVYGMDYIKKDGSISNLPWMKYSILAFGLEDGKWVHVDLKKKTVMNAIQNWAWISYQRNKSRSGASKNDDFFDAFKEVE